MKKIGGYLAVVGIALIVLPYLGLTIRFLGWIDELGTLPAWAIKIGLVVVGAVLFFMGKPEVEETELELPKEDTAE
ncbi:hypothetical protein [uncultured Winogradskyella sp.]|uniref:hypothetical protein n=1 Tax=uncultured Winogradskyella sp. TaxID=395353 RepID=UPI00262CE996|nr:hypothetical protein [uncultured Winogradskyella sp.]|tara:strand:+ start:5309 stop:5536 length:228 start_codon:yes stop_codon:yes gene_type:complete